MNENKRQHQRFAATPFLNRPVRLRPLPPFFDRIVKGKLIDLSAGGMAISMREIIPQGTFLQITLNFPDGTLVSCKAEVKRTSPRGKIFLHGIEFLDLEADLVERIDKMSADYLGCETRIQSQAENICDPNCTFFTMCTKPEKSLVPTDEPVIEILCQLLAAPHLL